MIRFSYFTKADFAELISWIPSEPFMVQWGGAAFTFPLHIHQLDNYIKEANYPGASQFVYKVVDAVSHQSVGHVALAIDRKNESGRISKVLVGPVSLRGSGIGTQIAEEIAVLAFEQLKLHRLSLGVFDFNHSAIKCYEKAGFQKEGLLRDARKVGNSYWNLWEMSMLENEWKQKQKKKA